MKKSIIALLMWLSFCSNLLAADVNLAWDANTETNLAGYKLYMGTASRTYGTPVTLGKVTTYTKTGLALGTYYFAVTAFNTNATNNESGYSNEVTTVISVPDTTPPLLSAIQATGISNTGATINWTTNETSNTQVEYGLTTAYGASTVLNAAMVTAHSQQVTGLVANTLYHYRVKSADAAANLTTSPDNSFTTTNTTIITGNVQNVSGGTDGTASTTYSLSFPATIGISNAVCGIVSWDNPSVSSLTSITDDKNNTYTILRRLRAAGNSQNAASFYLSNITNSSKTITATFSASVGWRGLALRELTGVDVTSPLNGETGQVLLPAGTTTDSVTSGPITTTFAGNYIFGGAVVTSGSRVNPFTLGTGFSLLNQTGSTSTMTMGTEHLIQSSAGPIAATFTQSINDNCIVFVVAFKAASGSPIVTPAAPGNLLVK